MSQSPNQASKKRTPRNKVKAAQASPLTVMLLSKQSGSTAQRPIAKALTAEHQVGVPQMNSAFLAAMRETPFYSHPFIGCKVLNVQLTSANVGWTGIQFAIMPNVTQGVADNQRTGDIIRVLGADLRMRASLGTAAAPASNAEYQITVAYSPLSSLSITTIYQDVGTAYSGCSPRDWDYSPVVKKLNHVFSFVDQYHPMRTHDLSFRCNLLTNYEAGTSTVATGALNVACISGEDTAFPTQLPSIYGNMQLFYQDV